MTSMPPPPPAFSAVAREVQAVMPTAVDAGKSITVSGFKITTRKLPILNAQEIDAMTEKLGIAPPEMIFGNNIVSIEKVGADGGAVAENPWKIEFNALDALDLVDKTGNDMLKVAYSSAWQKQREKMHEGIKEVVKPFDWTYSTNYQGSITPGAKPFEPTEDQIPLDKLRRQDPILFFDDVMLYEDELADNGMSILSVKIRVMPARLLLLARFYMRLDDVVFRIRDTRVFVEFAEGLVLREYQEREDSYDNVRQKIPPYRDDIPAIMRDPNQMAEYLPLRSVTVEKVVL
ncbi:hypothetical protein H072_7972 [Dactylellina haptotyla CBS 200.50]|uniref:TIP41-like protein n=1 Tax=Dactylellina haptotyla (strain CBS 200.50) TaxID=1284197 RepID=S8A579_DACHA|nr:hypothetical protein H072_7972 [Dactylellina haptotyla CBS 200.50]